MKGINATMAMMALACLFNDQVVPHSWASCMDIGGKTASSSVAGVMNLMGNLAGTTSSLLGGFILQRSSGDWNLFIAILASVYFLGIFCWPFIDSQRPLDGVS
jgi:ACS family glucarate transporter-like MFS transporter